MQRNSGATSDHSQRDKFAMMQEQQQQQQQQEHGREQQQEEEARQEKGDGSSPKQEHGQDADKQAVKLGGDQDKTESTPGEADELSAQQKEVADAPKLVQETPSQAQQRGEKRKRSGGLAIRNEQERRERVPLLVWNAERKLAWLCEERGKHVSRMGFSRRGTKWLWPEEAAFLVSEGEADLATVEARAGSKPSECTIAPLDQAYVLTYEALQLHQINLVDYYAFVALKKLRFNVFRAGAWGEKPDEAWFERTEAESSTSASQESGTTVEAIPLPGPQEPPSPCVMIRFDVYSPQTSNFSVNARGTPNFRVATSRPADRMPSVLSMRDLAKACDQEGTKLRMALFDGQAVSFVQVEDYELQDIAAATAVQPDVA
ncbi:Hypothetical Protein FCC1311_071742 [Hondaea fermentalgiana]|uniref:tRNA-splicing endonuclease subunit Sen54 N-terminal domain-containing protein n=1 Tax=Hondaea fermentalgiana TaxID=2315210 RepID=A0A2R5GQP7_9STRA|nr:Hypothetical Protein FCC1311_071742 [Hondaea fermentalgiana]|eukprot:GBG30953.1 Hypothetical Protein FCC1311_071742 [Hondaea fermentalgiana]